MRLDQHVMYSIMNKEDERERERERERDQMKQPVARVETTLRELSTYGTISLRTLSGKSLSKTDTKTGSSRKAFWA